jgi:hypothetical protein
VDRNQNVTNPSVTNETLKLEYGINF